MPTNVLMPALSPTMTEGTLLKWLVKEGDEVHAGDVIAEIETDKATMEVEAVDEGRVGRLVVPAGTQGVKVNSVIAVLVNEGEAAGAPATPAGEPAASAPPGPEPASRPAPSPAQGDGGAPPKATPLAERMARQAGLDLSSLSATGPGGKIGKADVEAALGLGDRGINGAPAAAGVPARPESADRRFASPLARRLAAEAGLDLGSVEGTGPNGRIVRRDVETALAAGPLPGRAAPQPAAPAPAAPAAVEAPPLGAAYAGMPAFELVPHTSMRRTIARRLSESKQTIPHFYLNVDCQIDELLAVRKALNARAPEGVKLSVNDLVIKAVALGLRKVPDANAAWHPDGLLRFKGIDISVAVAIPGGLITPVIRDADRKGLADISREMADLAARARAGKLKPEEYLGGTISISNLGMYGISSFSAVINPPQAAIIAVGAGEPRPVVKAGQLAVATVMTCTLSCDHRVIDGALGAELLGAVRSYIEYPAAMLL